MDNSNRDDDIEDIQKQNKIKKQKIKLIIILIIGVILIVGAFWYSNNSKKQRAEELKNKIQSQAIVTSTVDKK